MVVSLSLVRTVCTSARASTIKVITAARRPMAIQRLKRPRPERLRRLRSTRGGKISGRASSHQGWVAVIDQVPRFQSIRTPLASLLTRDC